MKNNISNFKFFWWEPLLAFDDIKYIINSSFSTIWNNYEIVTNTTLLTNEIWEYLNKYFKLIFFSIDSENLFNYEKVDLFINRYCLNDRVYFNLIINPWKTDIALLQFKKLYKLWFRWFNILPVYFTKEWSKIDLKKLSEILNYILKLSIEDNSLKLYWFQENLWTEVSLINESLFIDINWKIYYSDIVSTFLGKIIKNKLCLWKTSDIILKQLNQNSILLYKKYISLLEKKVYNNKKWQKELRKVMDYFSNFLNKSKWAIKE